MKSTAVSRNIFLTVLAFIACLLMFMILKKNDESSNVIGSDIDRSENVEEEMVLPPSVSTAKLDIAAKEGGDIEDLRDPDSGLIEFGRDDPKKWAKNFYSKAFVSRKNMSGKKEVYSGEPVYVYSLTNKYEPPSLFIPLMSTNTVEAISIFRKYENKEYKPGRVYEVSFEFEDSEVVYPPVSLSEAETLFLDKFPEIHAESDGKLYHLDGRIPQYKFVDFENNTYIVNAHNGDVNLVPEDMLVDNRRPFAANVDDEGLMVFDQDLADKYGYTDAESEMFKDQIEVVNEEIRSGNLRIDKNFKPIVDQELSNVKMLINTPAVEVTEEGYLSLNAAAKSGYNQSVLEVLESKVSSANQYIKNKNLDLSNYNQGANIPSSINGDTNIETMELSSQPVQTNVKLKPPAMLATEG